MDKSVLKKVFERNKTVLLFLLLIAIVSVSLSIVLVPASSKSITTMTVSVGESVGRKIETSEQIEQQKWLDQNIDFTNECFNETEERTVCQGTVKNLSNEDTVTGLKVVMIRDRIRDSDSCPSECIEGDPVFEIGELAPNQSTDYMLSCSAQDTTRFYFELVMTKSGMLPSYPVSCSRELFD